MINKLLVKLITAVALIFTGVSIAHATCPSNVKKTTPDEAFTVHGDGTVTHNASGLMWQRCSLGQTWTGQTCEGTATGLILSDALKTAETNNFAGYHDWRVPSRNEMESIVELGCWRPPINLNIFPNTPGTSGTSYWTSTPLFDQFNSVQTLSMDGGGYFTSPVYQPRQVRLVR